MDESIVAALEGVVDRRPDAWALEDATRRLTYRELDSAGNRLARRLRALGVDAEARVAVAVERSIDAVVSYVGILKAGGAYVPLDVDDPVARLDLMLRDTDARVVLARPELVARLPSGHAKLVELDGTLLDPGDSHRLLDRPGSRALACVMYTSGSTGKPKGVAIEHRGIVHYMREAHEIVAGEDDAVLHANRLGFDAASYDIWSALLNGARLVVHPPDRLDPRALAATMRGHGVTVAGLATGLFHQLVDGAPHAFDGMRLVLAGGDVLSPDHARRFRERHPDVRLVNDYGPTETTISATWHEVRAIRAGETVPIGRPVGRTRLSVVDAELRPVKAGEAGELCIGGPGVARGYLNLPELTAERFVTDPDANEPGAHRYRTGDRVRRRPDGELEFLGRGDAQVKVRGFRVETGEIEVQLAAHPEVERAVVVAREDAPGRRRLVAYVVAPAIRGDTSSIRRALATQLPTHALPSRVVVLPELPLTATGEIDRSALPEPGPAVQGSSCDPTGATELTMAGIWRTVLGIATPVADDDFFELGGDSLLALQVLSRVRDALGVELPLDAVFDSPTLSGLATLVEAERARGTGPGTGSVPLPPIRPRRRPGAVSFGQAQALFFGDLQEEALPYQFQAVLWLDGTLDVGALERALTELVRRHDILRTTFPRRRDGWRQRVHPPWAVRLSVLDATRAQDPEAELERHVEREFRVVLDTERLPLVRWTLVRVARERHALLLLEHHVVHDGWSFTLELRELAELYRAFAEGRPSPLPEPPIQFADFAAWQHELLDSELVTRQLAHWSQVLTPLPPLIELPLDRPRPARQTFRGDIVDVTLPSELTAALNARSAEHGATLFITMLAAFYALLHSYGASDDLVVGSGLSNRRRRETEDLLGMVVNTVALRADLGGDPTLGELLTRVRAVALDAYANQDVPFERVVEVLAPPRRPDHAPVYQTMFSFHDSPVPDLRLPHLTITPDDTRGNGSTKAELNVVCINRRVVADGPGANRLTVLWEYNTDLFDRRTAEAMTQHYVALLGAFASNPDLRLSELVLTSPSERAELLALGTGSTREYERDASIAEVFAARVAERPDAPAVATDDGIAYSYIELDDAAEALANRLRWAGAAPGACVGLLVERSLEMIVSLVAVAKTGAAYVALDPAHPPERLRFLLHDARIRLVCATSGTREWLPPGARARLVLVDDTVPAAPCVDAPIPEMAGPTDLAYVAYTSGSTGRPKGVEITQRGVVRLVRGADYIELGPNETLLAFAPLAFDASTFEIWGALLNGARLALAPPGPLTARELAEVVERTRVTTLWLTAGLFHQLVDHAPDGLGRVRQLLAGGDILSPTHVAGALRALPEDGVLVNGYGPAEGTTFTCCHRMSAGGRVVVPVPIGRPIANTRVVVLDARGEPVPVGVPGELYVGGDGVARGYLGRPDLTAERFEPDPFVSGGRRYRTGDRVRWRRDGTLEFLGRVDRQVKVRGFRVEPAEVEHVLALARGVADVAVVARDDRVGDRRLVAYVVPEADAIGVPDPSVDRPAAWRAFLAERLPAYLIPSAWVTLAQLPLTPNGKVDRDALPDPGDARIPSSAAPSPPRTGLERMVTAAFEEVLNVKPVGIDDDFFKLGGHSLLAVVLFARIERAIGVRLPLATIFEAPTVVQLATVLSREGWEAPWSSVVPLSTGGTRLPLFCVAAGDANTVGFGALARHLGDDQPFYALQPRGLDGRRRMQRRVEAMAVHYLAEIRARQPHGPYLLGGRCLGGIVAYELARLLEAAGDRVALVVVLDSLGPRWQPRALPIGVMFDEVMNLAYLRARADGYDVGDVLRADGAAALVAYLQESVEGRPVNRYLHEAYLARPDVQAAYPDLRGEDAGRLIDWAWVTGRHEMEMSAALLPPPGPAAASLRVPRTPRARAALARVAAGAVDWLDLATRGRTPRLAARRDRRLQDVAREATAAYRAGSYGGRVTLLRSCEMLDDVEIARWYGLETGGVEEHLVDGSHRSMLREPDVASLAQQLESCIRAATR